MVSFSGSMILIRATLRFLKRIPTEETRTEVVRLLLRGGRTPESKGIVSTPARSKETGELFAKAMNIAAGPKQMTDSLCRARC